MLIIANNLGVLPAFFFPRTSGKDYELSPYLSGLADFRSDFTVFSGLSHPGVSGGHSADNCLLTGDPTRPGLYYTLVRWWPGFMSAPHHYTTDRLCVVVSGTWWCNSGADFDPAACVPVPAGSFVHRVAGTPHYDGVVRGHSEPAIIAICGIGPVNFVLNDASQAGVRRV